MFWPDMGCVHYAREVIELFKCKNIKFIHWDECIPTVPQAHLIERFWAVAKRQYSLRKNKSKDQQDVTGIWQNISYEVAQKSGLKLMFNIHKELHKVVRGIMS